MKFLPINKQDMDHLGWDEVDFAVVTGDAYVDHPSFGASTIARVLEAEGFRVGVIAQPSWADGHDISAFGRPKYGFFVTAGNIDSMVAHYTAAKRRRSEDAYSPGNRAGLRPDRAATVYSRLIKQFFPDIPVILGGLEASLRRFAHYDYWSDRLMPSVLIDSCADLLVFGMGEKQTREAARALSMNNRAALNEIPGTVYVADNADGINGIRLPGWEKVCASKEDYARSCRMQHENQDAINGKTLIQAHGKQFVIQNRPMPPLNQSELDEVAALPFMRDYHPSYEPLGGVPSIEEVRFSIIHNRGCFGACSFCSLAYHQGRSITSRSKQSILAEAKAIIADPKFKGYIHDVGGPTANFRKPSCERQKKFGLCKGRRCLAPSPCEHLASDHSEYLEILRDLRRLPGVKKVFIRSGIRFDYLCRDKNEAFFKELVAHHISGQLKVAPEHVSDHVLRLMGKPPNATYIRFSKRFYELTKSMNKEQYLVPYLMSSHPGSRLSDALELALFLKQNNLRPQQVQDFYPTPGTLSTCMFYTGLNPIDLKPVYVPKSAEEKDLQRALLQYYKPENRKRVTDGMKKAGLGDKLYLLYGGAPPKPEAAQWRQTSKPTRRTKKPAKSMGYKTKK